MSVKFGRQADSQHEKDVTDITTFDDRGDVAMETDPAGTKVVINDLLCFIDSYRSTVPQYKLECLIRDSFTSSAILTATNLLKTLPLTAAAVASKGRIVNGSTDAGDGNNNNSTSAHNENDDSVLLSLFDRLPPATSDSGGSSGRRRPTFAATNLSALPLFVKVDLSLQDVMSEIRNLKEHLVNRSSGSVDTSTTNTFTSSSSCSPVGVVGVGGGQPPPPPSSLPPPCSLSVTMDQLAPPPSSAPVVASVAASSPESPQPSKQVSLTNDVAAAGPPLVSTPSATSTLENTIEKLHKAAAVQQSANSGASASVNKNVTVRSPLNERVGTSGERKACQQPSLKTPSTKDAHHHFQQHPPPSSVKERTTLSLQMTNQQPMAVRNGGSADKTLTSSRPPFGSPIFGQMSPQWSSALMKQPPSVTNGAAVASNLQALAAIAFGRGTGQQLLSPSTDSNTAAGMQAAVQAYYTMLQQQFQQQQLLSTLMAAPPQVSPSAGGEVRPPPPPPQTMAVASSVPTNLLTMSSSTPIQPQERTPSSTSSLFPDLSRFQSMATLVGGGGAGLATSAFIRDESSSKPGMVKTEPSAAAGNFKGSAASTPEDDYAAADDGDDGSPTLMDDEEDGGGCGDEDDDDEMLLADAKEQYNNNNSNHGGASNDDDEATSSLLSPSIDTTSGGGGGGGKPYVCKHNHCRKQFNNKFLLKKHEFIHTGERPHQCPFCGKRFNRKDNLLRHKKTHIANAFHSSKRRHTLVFGVPNGVATLLGPHTGVKVGISTY